VFVSTTIVVLSGADATVAETLALRVPALAGEGPLLLVAVLFGLLFLVQSAAA
jgi:hypothetical protein